jgi:CTP:molybdopterin cytidylyltransferase MocA
MATGDLAQPRRNSRSHMTIVILAAGAARRMGSPKLLLPIDGQPMIECVLAAARDWPVVVVAGDDVAPTLGEADVRIVRNDAPERGMAHSLRLANAVIPAREPIAILLADQPDITSEVIARVIAAYDDAIDVVVPTCEGVLAHPVIFGPRARRKIADLADGDVIKRLRDDTDLARRVVELNMSALHDIDTPHDYAQRAGQRVATAETSP